VNIPFQPFAGSSFACKGQRRTCKRGWATLPRMRSERVRLITNSLAFVVYWMLQRYTG